MGPPRRREGGPGTNRSRSLNLGTDLFSHQLMANFPRQRFVEIAMRRFLGLISTAALAPRHLFLSVADRLYEVCGLQNLPCEGNLRFWDFILYPLDFGRYRAF